MKWIVGTWDFACAITLLAVCAVELVAQTEPPQNSPIPSKIDPTELQERATRVMNSYCVSCHGSDKQEGELQLNELETIDPVDRQALFKRVQEVIQLSEMPRKKRCSPANRNEKSCSNGSTVN